MPKGNGKKMGGGSKGGRSTQRGIGKSNRKRLGRTGTKSK